MSRTIAVTSGRSPQRTCVACRRTGDKRALIRLVRTPVGGVAVDPSGKLPGRGAYLCPTKSCWQAALKKNRLEHALGTQLAAENRQFLVGYSENLPEGS